jgi:hypothetical protein
MTRGRLRFSPWLGLLDLVFLLCMLFFLTTVISMRQIALAEDVADDRADGNRRPVVLRLARVPERAGGDVDVQLVSAGGRTPPKSAPVLAWVADACREHATSVEIACPAEATHRGCKAGVLSIRRAAPECRFKY